MKHAVLKLGGSILRGAEGAADVLDILDSYEGPLIAVVSALKGMTDRLARTADDSINAAARGLEPPDPGAFVAELRGEHLDFAAALDAPSAAFHASALRLDCLLSRLAGFLEKGDARYRDEILAAGERLSATLIALALVALGRPARIVEPPELGLAVSEGAEGAYVDLSVAGPRIRAALSRYRDAVVPGFYGIGDDGRVRLLGRGGSDYSAALVAAALEARSCDLVKDVSGFLTADPAIVKGARQVLELSYEEAEALANGGAKVLHHCAVEPLRSAGVPLRIVGASSLAGATLIGEGPFSREGARALALQRGPAGAARITVACRGYAASCAASVIGALEAGGIPIRAFAMGPRAISFNVLIDGSKAEAGLRLAHEVLFETKAHAIRSTIVSQKPGVA
jgi:aspartate kinase/aspartokinase/homoserine dehydrogenase 1